MNNTAIKEYLVSMLNAAKSNLAKYEADGDDERAIIAGKSMVEMFETEIAALNR